jgi:hypothetical protein
MIGEFRAVGATKPYVLAGENQDAPCFNVDFSITEIALQFLSLTKGDKGIPNVQ